MHPFTSSEMIIRIFTTLSLFYTLDADVMRPRGVSLTKKAFYIPNQDFTCIDSSHVIPFSYVNDDYCDCDDGSDEPGTSACANGVFHCTNAGHRPLNIPSSRVNDGICDCCDASDEYNSSKKCVNNCKDLGRQAREEAVKQSELLTKGYQIRQEYSAQGKKRKEERKQKLQELSQQKIEAETAKQEKEAFKNEAEELEKAALEKYKTEEDKVNEEKDAIKDQGEADAAFIDLDSNQDGKLSLEEIKRKWVFDSNNDGEVTDDEGKFFMNQKEEMSLEEFHSIGWILMRPHYSKQTMFKPPSSDEEDEDADLPADIDADDTDPIDSEVGDVENAEDDERSSDSPKFPEEDTGAVENEDKEDAKPVYDENTQALIDAAEKTRKEFDDACTHYLDVDREIKDLEQSMDVDLGENDEFAPLQDQCFEYQDREYTYTLCPFVKASQKPHSGGSDVSLGTWGVWSGEDDAKYSRMKYERGLNCWNGPARSAEVKLSCGVENQLLAVSEPNRCEYLFEFTTPAACSSLAKPGHEDSHDEL